MTRRKHDANFKARVALEALKNDLTIAEIANKYSVGPTQIKDWKAALIAQSESIFSKDGKRVIQDDSEKLAVLERKIGQLTIENDFLKKNLLKFHGKHD